MVKMTTQSDLKLKEVNNKISQRKKIFIRKVILENFLSFQKDEVDFGKAKFVIIVGPNWSGKTSVFQAIKFALGSNERDERYKKWSNFIRNGQNHAMVEIHIQNDEELIKIRRMVIRGQSPFFKIQRKNDNNFKKVQAHEIQKLISDLSINPDNQFAIVSQGKIDAIKNLKPTELCTFLEEGIDLKSLREEILQQKTNLLNLNTELNSLISKKNTLNISLELIKPKLERLKQKNELLQTKKKINDELLWANRDKLQEEINSLQETIKNLELGIDGIKNKKKKQDKDIQELSEKIATEERTINKLSVKKGELNYQKQDLFTKIQQWQKEKLIVKQELDSLSEKIEKIRKLNNNFIKQEESLDTELNIIKKNAKEIELNIDSLIKEQNQLVRKIKQNKTLLDEYNLIISEKRENLKQFQDNENLIKSNTDQINQLFQSFKDIEHKLEKNKWFLENPTQNLLQQLDKELRNTSLKIYEIESKIKQLEIERSKKLRKLKLLQGSLRERRVILPSNISVLKEEIRKRDLKVKGPIIDYLKYRDELSYAIESVLGEKLLYSFVARDWDTLNLLKRLKNKYNAYCNIYIAKSTNITPFPKITIDGVIGYLAELIDITDDDIEIKKVIYSKVKNCLVVKDYHSGIALYKNFNFKGKCVTLKGEQIVSYKYVYETPYLKRLKGLLSAGTQKEQSEILESEIKLLNNHISELRVEQSKLDETQKVIFRKKEAFNDLLFNFNQKQRITTKKNLLYKQIHNLEEINASIQVDIHELDQKIKELKIQSDPDFFKWNDRVREIPNELTLLNEEKKKWNVKLNEHLQFLKEIKEKISENKNRFRTIEQEYKTKKENFQKADKSAFNIYQQLEQLDEELEEIEKKILNSNGLKSQYQFEKSEIEKRNIQNTLKLEQETIKLNTVNQEFELKKKDLKRINSELAPLILDKKLDIRPIDEIEKDLLKIDKQLLKFLDIDDSILIERDQIISSLKEIVKNQKDIENDIKAAIKTEKKMEKTYYNRFGLLIEELQSKINQKFESSQIKAYCSLGLTGDFENLGVTIKAATSKDQLKSFSALSGGQMSMISICLILSLQEIKPSPLCMFDEAGMFLDEKNSEIAYQLIKSTLERNPIQLLMFLPKSSSILFNLAEKLIGIARVGKNEVSSVFKPKIIKKKKE